MKNKIVRHLLCCGALVLILVAFGYRYYESGAVTIDEHALYSVIHVKDGDTIDVHKNGSREKAFTIRLLGINTPETVDPRKGIECFGPEASEETKSLLNGRNVRLKINPKRELKDKYGRYLLYVYLENGLFLNEYLVENGYAREYTYGSPYIFQRDFKEKETEAKNAHRGLWSRCEAGKA